MSDQRSPQEIRREIAETREDLAETAAALAYKADVKSRASERVDEIKQDIKSTFTGARARTPDSVGAAAASTAGTVKENPVPAAIAAIVIGFALGYMLAARRNTD